MRWAICARVCSGRTSVRADASLELDHDLDRFAVVHCTVAIGPAVEIRHAVEYASRIDSSLHHIRHQLLDVSPHRSRSAADRDVLEEAVIARWNRLVLRNADATDRSARTSDTEGREHRFLEPDALENGMCADALRQLANLVDRRFTALAHDVRGAELLRQRDPIGMTPQHDDLLGAEPARRDHAAEADRAIADDSGGFARTNFRMERRMMTRAHDIGERE